jgi:hypothetical protein
LISFKGLHSRLVRLAKEKSHVESSVFSIKFIPKEI